MKVGNPFTPRYPKEQKRIIPTNANHQFSTLTSIGPRTFRKLKKTNQNQWKTKEEIILDPWAMFMRGFKKAEDLIVNFLVILMAS